MRVWTQILLLAVFTNVPAAAQQPQMQPADQQEAQISGTVLDAATGQPLNKSWLLLREMGGRRSRGASPTRPGTFSTFTDSSGHFQFGKLDPGQYSLRIGRNGYVDQAYGNPTGKGRDTPLSLNAGTNMNGLKILLTPAGVITGQVTDEDGDPIPWVRISALRIIYSDDGTKRLYPVAQASTNDLGQYRVFGVAPGQYLVEASYRPGMGDIGPGNFVHRIIANSGNTTYPPQTFFPGASNLAEATQVSVAAGQQTSSIDFQLIPARAYRVAGQVTGATVSGLNGHRSPINVFLLPEGSDFGRGPWPYRTFVMGDGHFTIEGVLPGRYTLWAAQYSDENTTAASTTVTVNGGDVTGVSLLLQPPSELPGRVSVESQSSPPLGMVVYLLSLTPRPFGGGYGKVQEDGSFDLKDVIPGGYWVETGGLPDGAYVESIHLGSRDALSHPLQIDSGGTTDPLSIVVGLHGAQISGTVQNSDQKPVAGATVVLVPETSMRDAHLLYTSAGTEEDGSFTLNGIRPGRYDLFAWQEVDSGAWFDPSFLKPFESQATEIEVSRGEQKTVQLQVIPAATTQN